jgi:hypothetical protein
MASPQRWRNDRQAAVPSGRSTGDVAAPLLQLPPAQKRSLALMFDPGIGRDQPDLPVVSV